MREDHFDEPVAEIYDGSVAEMFEPEAVAPAVELLAGLAGDGAALELGIGTAHGSRHDRPGRVARSATRLSIWSARHPQRACALRVDSGLSISRPATLASPVRALD